jgi:rhamnose utilization protein RhaD (predicted bifunctional aldolase and dehydrogenase)
VNGLTCSQQGETAMERVFGNDAIWIPSINPGYILSKTVKTAMDKYRVAHNKPVSIIFLQNHGVFVGDNSINGIKDIYSSIMDKISALIKRWPLFSDEVRISNDAGINRLKDTLANLAGGAAVFMRSKEIDALVKDRLSFSSVSSAFTPDHIVYAGSNPLFVELGLGTSDQYPSNQEAAHINAELIEAWNKHVKEIGMNPKIIAIQGMGVFGAAATERAANLALDLWRDAARIAAYSESFGGPLFMTPDKIHFINNWEVERFRVSVSTK